MNHNDRVALQFAVSYTIDGLREKLLPIMAANKESLYPRMVLLLDQLEAIQRRLDAMTPPSEKVAVGDTDVEE